MAKRNGMMRPIRHRRIMPQGHRVLCIITDCRIIPNRARARTDGGIYPKGNTVIAGNGRLFTNGNAVLRSRLPFR